MQIRRVRPDDLPAVQVLLTQLMPGLPHRRRAMWEVLTQHPGYSAWVAEADGMPVGYLDLIVFPDIAHGEFIGLINNLVVSEPYRRRGLGTRLLQEAVAQARRQGAVEVHVWTDFDNTGAIRLYKDVGFAERALLLELEMTAEGHRTAPK